MNSFRAIASLAKAAMAAMAALAPVSICAGCGGDATFEVKYASDYSPPPARATVSLFGIYRDGRLSPESWAEYGARLSAPFHGDGCDVAFNELLHTANPALFTSLDDYARANGVSDELFEQIAAKAKGDLVMLLQMYGRPPRKAGVRHPMPKGTLAQMGGMGRGPSPAGGSHQPITPLPDKPDARPLELSAVLYSVRLHHVVAEISLRYTGASVDDAFRKFNEKLEASLPGSSCRGWNWEASPDGG